MEKGLLFLILSLACFWVILDDFFGNRHLSNFTRSISPNPSTPVDKVVDKVEEIKDNYDKASEEYQKRRDTLGGKFQEKYGPA